MSATHRTLTRLPLHIFENLTERSSNSSSSSTSHTEEGVDGKGAENDATHVRSLLCSKLKQASTNSNFHNSSSASSSNICTTQTGGGGITTVGELLKLSIPALLRAVDPLLIYEECKEFVRRICMFCAPCPITALDLLRSTEQDGLQLLSSSSLKKDRTARSSTATPPTPNNRNIRHLTSGVPALDAILKGGFRIGTITELVGRAGVGKTQLALQLCVLAARYELGTVYIDTEKKLSLLRLQEIAKERAATPRSHHPCSNPSFVAAAAAAAQQQPQQQQGQFSYACDNHDDSTDLSAPVPTTGTTCGKEKTATPHDNGPAYKTANDVLENVTVHTPGSTNELLSVVGTLEEEILLRNQDATEEYSQPANNQREKTRRFPVKLIIIDNIAAPTRRDFGKESAPQRVSTLFQIAQSLKRLADQLQVAVVVINQVGLAGDNTATHGNDHLIANNSVGSDLVAVSAALGTSWHHCVSTRLLLEHERDPHRLNTILDEAHTKSAEHNEQTVRRDRHAAWKFNRGHIRTATVVKSNAAGVSSMSYEVTGIGLSEVE